MREIRDDKWIRKYVSQWIMGNKRFHILSSENQAVKEAICSFQCAFNGQITWKTYRVNLTLPPLMQSDTVGRIFFVSLRVSLLYPFNTLNDAYLFWRGQSRLSKSTSSSAILKNKPHKRHTYISWLIEYSTTLIPSW